MRQPGVEDLAGQPLDAGRGRTLPDADRDHARGQEQDVAALHVLVVPAVDLAGADEARVLGVDQLGQLRLALAGGHREAGHGHPVADPHAGVAREQQVGQRVDEEVVGAQQAGDQTVAAADLVVAHAGGQDVGEIGGGEVTQRLGEVAPQGVAEVEAAERAGDRVVARELALEGLGEQLGEVEDLDPAVAQRLGEGVVLLLRPAHPGDAVEQQPVVVARGQSLELVAGAVEHDRGQPADFTVSAVGGSGGGDHDRTLAGVTGARPRARAAVVALPGGVAGARSAAAAQAASEWPGKCARHWSPRRAGTPGSPRARSTRWTRRSVCSGVL